VAVIIVILVLWLDHRQSDCLCDNLGNVYDQVQTYSDSSVIKVESGTLSLGVESQFAFARPNKFVLNSSLKILFGECKVQVYCDGHYLWAYVPAIQQYLQEPAPPNTLVYLEQSSRIEPMFEVLHQAISIYAILFSTNTQQTLHMDAEGLRLAGNGEIKGQPVRRFNWLGKSELSVPLGNGNFSEHEIRIPSTVWVRKSDGAFVKSVTDLDALRSALADDKVQILKFTGTNLVATAEHRDIRLNPDLNTTEFTFHPPQDAKLVKRLDFTKVFPVFSDPSLPVFPK